MLTVLVLATTSTLAAFLAHAGASQSVSEDVFHTDPIPNTFKVPLDRHHVPVVIDGREVAKKTAYFGTLFVGYPQPQRYTVVFDTGSGHVFLPSSDCADEACRLHNTYKRDHSSSSLDINHDGSRARGAKEDRDSVSISYGTGEIVGDVVREVMCVAAPPPKSLPATAWRPELKTSTGLSSFAPHCTRARLITAKTMTSEPFSFFNFDGVLGLGLAGLALDPEFHFFGQMTKDNRIEPVFSFFVSRSDEVPSEITFGGSDPGRFSGAMHWVPVFGPEQGHWKVWIRDIRVENESTRFCDDGQCSAIVDTGTSVLGVPSETMNNLLWKTAQVLPNDAAEDMDCRHWHGSSIVFEMSGGFTVELGPEDYMRPSPSRVPSADSNDTQRVCRANLLPLDMPSLGKKVFIWGAPVLQKYYTSYDSRRERVGFAPALQPKMQLVASIHATANTTSAMVV